MYWGVYVSTALEADYLLTGDPNTTKRLFGLTDLNDQMSMIFLETIQDQGQWVDFTPAQNRSAVTVHEVGHQFDLAFGVPANADWHRDDPPNIMSGEIAVHAQEYYFHEIDVAHMRDEINGPGHD
jgi:hypothetical protein